MLYFIDTGVDKDAQKAHKKRRESFLALTNMIEPLDLFSRKGRDYYPGVAKAHTNIFFDFNQQV